MFPVRDDNPPLSVPYATIALVIVNALVWALLQGLGGEPQLSRSICRLALIPAELLGYADAGTRIPLSENLSCTIGVSNSWHTLLSSMFAHGGWMHILGNMWFLWIFGNNVEDSMGHGRFIVFYLLCGLAAAATQIAVNPESVVPMVGASGAIGGVMGAYILLFPRVNVHMLIILGFYITTVAVPAVFMLGYWFLLQLLSGVSTMNAAGGGVAFWAHAGGFIAGAILVLLFRDPERLARHPFVGWKKPSPGRWRRIDR